MADDVFWAGSMFMALLFARCMFVASLASKYKTQGFSTCLSAKGEESDECEKFARYYRSLCPGEWVEKWNEQRGNGTFPGPL